MERKVTKLEHSHVEVLVTVDEKTWVDAQKKAEEKIAQTISIPGFRPGKAPLNMVKNKIDPAKVMDEAINALLPVAYSDILKNEDIKPFAQPKVDITKISQTELEIKFSFVTIPEVKLGNYKGLKIGHGKVEVTDKEVEDAIAVSLKDNASLVVKDGVSANGDTVVIDFKGTIDGVAFEGGSSENYELELGSHSFIPGFEDQLVGHKAGEHVDVAVKFPENYVENLKGKDAIFACDIHEVKEKKLPELNDEFVKDLGIKDVETVEAFKAHKKAELENGKKNNEHREYVGKLLDTIAASSTFDIPDEIMDQQVQSRKEDLIKRMQQSGLTLEQYLSMVGQKEEEFDAKLKEEAKKEVINYLVMSEVGKAEKITVNDEELDFEIAKLAEQYNMKVEDVKKALGNQMDEFRHNTLMNHIEEFLTKNND